MCIPVIRRGYGKCRLVGDGEVEMFGLERRWMEDKINKVKRR